MTRPAFRFVDLFAGIGGFHAIGSALGGECVYAVEIDPRAADVYSTNWGLDPSGDFTLDANDEEVSVPEHDVLFAGFPCQPFSKSGNQRGMDEARGTLYWHILRVLEERRPSLVVLENVRNLVGPRHKHEWNLIIETLRDCGYKVSETPTIFSPHLLPRNLGGRPQRRDRVYITATYVGAGIDVHESVPAPLIPSPINGWDPGQWELDRDIPLEADHHVDGCDLSESEVLWINAWADFVQLMLKARNGRRLPGFPLWVDSWIHEDELRIPRGTPDWKKDFIQKNSTFYTSHQKVLDRWLKKWNVLSDDFTPARRKFEWQAQDLDDLWSTVMHLRPSGLRAKAPTYVPALVAITQTSIIGERERRLSVREAARLQGLPDWFDFGDQRPAASFRQLGNGISIGAAWYVIKQHAERDSRELRMRNPRLLRAIRNAPLNPDVALEHMKP